MITYFVFALYSLFVGDNGGDDVIQQLVIYMDILSLSSGQQLFDVNTLTDSIYIVKSGTLDITVIADDSRPVRIRKVGPGAILGEISMYLDTPTTAAANATEPTEMFCLSRVKLNQMLREQPELAALFHARIARLLAHRLADNSRLIRQLASS